MRSAAGCPLQVERLAEAHCSYAQLVGICELLQDEPRLHYYMAAVGPPGEFPRFVMERLHGAGRDVELLNLPAQFDHDMLAFLEVRPAAAGWRSLACLALRRRRRTPTSTCSTQAFMLLAQPVPTAEHISLCDVSPRIRRSTRAGAGFYYFDPYFDRPWRSDTWPHMTTYTRLLRGPGPFVKCRVPYSLRDDLEEIGPKRTTLMSVPWYRTNVKRLSRHSPSTARPHTEGSRQSRRPSLVASK